MSGSPIRFTGLFSGMDTQSMVTQLMRAEGMRMDRLTRRRQMAQWRQEDLRNTMTVMNDFRRQQTSASVIDRNTIMDGSLWNTMRGTATNGNGAVISGVTITTRTGTAAQNVDVRVMQVAQGGRIQSGATFRGNATPNAPIIDRNTTTMANRFGELEWMREGASADMLGYINDRTTATTARNAAQSSANSSINQINAVRVQLRNAMNALPSGDAPNAADYAELRERLQTAYSGLNTATATDASALSDFIDWLNAPGNEANVTRLENAGTAQVGISLSDLQNRVTPLTNSFNNVTAPVNAARTLLYNALNALPEAGDPDYADYSALRAALQAAYDELDPEAGGNAVALSVLNTFLRDNPADATRLSGLETYGFTSVNLIARINSINSVETARNTQVNNARNQLTRAYNALDATDSFYDSIRYMLTNAIDGLAAFDLTGFNALINHINSAHADYNAADAAILGDITAIGTHGLTVAGLEAHLTAGTNPNNLYNAFNNLYTQRGIVDYQNGLITDANNAIVAADATSVAGRIAARDLAAARLAAARADHIAARDNVVGPTGQSFNGHVADLNTFLDTFSDPAPGVPAAFRTALVAAMSAGSDALDSFLGNAANARVLTNAGLDLDDPAQRAILDGHASNIYAAYNYPVLAGYRNVLDAEIWGHARDSEAADIALASASATVNVNGVDISLRGDDTINTFMDRVNANPNVGAILRFDSLRGTFILESRETGDETDLTIGSSSNAGIERLFLNEIGMNFYNPQFTDEVPQRQQGQNAIIYFDGVRIEQASNTFEDVNGMDITLSTGLNVPSEGLDINVGTVRDVEPLMERIREFINAYNELVRNLNALHSTARPRSNNRAFYEPLTAEQRDAMSDREVEQWEERARTGMLHRDPDLRNIQQQMRQWIQAPVYLERDSFGRPVAGSPTLSLTQIGITTGYGGVGSSERLLGLMAIDEDRLRAALEENPEGVETLFTGNVQTSVTSRAARSARLGDQGVAARLNDIVEIATAEHSPAQGGTLRDRVGVAERDDGTSIMSRRIREYDERIEQMQAFLNRREAHFFRMFSRMEQAMAQSNAQMDALWSFAAM